VDVVLEGETLRIKLRPDDQLNAERQLGHSPADSPLELTWRSWWNALRRQYPDHPAAKTFGRFIDALEAGDELEPPDREEVGDMDPTRRAGSDI
jgi:hypothetical protein